MRALKVCTTSGCGELTTGGRCEQHRKQADRARGTARERGYDARWERTRKAYLRTHPTCERPDCYQPAKDVNHLDGEGPHGRHGHDAANLEALCHSHHSQWTARTQPGGWNQRD